MKTFLTICICAMVSAGLYGFADMAMDVKNGTMIQYDHGDGEEAIADNSVNADVSVAAGFVKEKKATRKKISSDVQVKQKSTTKVKSKKKIVKKVEPVVEKETQQVVIEENLKTDVKVDSVPQTEIKEERDFDYSDFSRGAPRKHKKSKSKKD